MDAQDVLNFWFEELDSSKWFAKNTELDETIKIRFADVLKSAAKGELYTWRTTALGRVAEIIVLDQFPRHIFRNQPEAFETDRMALLLAQEMVLTGQDKEVPFPERSFIYMPYMHSESRVVHDEAVKLFATEGMEEVMIYELDHKRIIDQFGRYPHRNAILHRLSTFKEIQFLQNHRDH